MPAHDSYVLVTGASGFVGASIVRYLAESGRMVLALDIEAPDPLVDDYLEGLEDRLSWVIIDLRDNSKVISIAKDYNLDSMIHAAVFTAVTKDVEQKAARDILTSNFMGTVNALELAREAEVKRFVYVSSSGLYGSTDNINKSVKENTSQSYPRMRDFYSITKIASEKLTERYSQLFPMSTTSMRIAAPYGPMERLKHSRNVMGPIFRLLRLVLTEEKKTIRVKGLDYVRDWTYVMDMAMGLVAGLDAPVPVSPLYNVSCGVNSSLEEILTAIQNVPGVDFNWIEVEADADADFAVNVSSLRGPLSIDRTHKELGFEPRLSLQEGINQYCQWWKDAQKKGIW